MKISIIPAYNGETYIRECLKHVLDQIEPADEVIVVNNNSTDKLEIIKSFLA
jgi:glycosyltransferase involved in cell wall biosynthesis